MMATDFVAHLAEGRNCCHEDDDAMAAQQAGHIADAQQIFATVVLGKSKIRAKGFADIVSVQYFDRQIPIGEPVENGAANGRLACAA